MLRPLACAVSPETAACTVAAGQLLLLYPKCLEERSQKQGISSQYGHRVLLISRSCGRTTGYRQAFGLWEFVGGGVGGRMRPTSFQTPKASAQFAENILGDQLQGLGSDQPLVAPRATILSNLLPLQTRYTTDHDGHSLHSGMFMSMSQWPLPTLGVHRQSSSMSTVMSSSSTQSALGSRQAKARQGAVSSSSRPRASQVQEQHFRAMMIEAGAKTHETDSAGAVWRR